MSRRGSARLLLLGFHKTAERACGVSAAVTALMLVGLAAVPAGVYLNRSSVISNLLLSSIWDSALTGGDATSAFPWDTSKAGPGAHISRLGMSASVLDRKEAEADAPRGDALRVEPARSVVGNSPVAAIPLDQISVGDRITITSADGMAHIYEVTDRHLLDQTKPAATDRPDAGLALITCKPLQSDVGAPLRLVIHAVHEAGPRDPAAGHEQKL